jgi:hypothetical protein
MDLEILEQRVLLSADAGAVAAAPEGWPGGGSIWGGNEIEERRLDDRQEPLAAPALQYEVCPAGLELFAGTQAEEIEMVAPPHRPVPVPAQPLAAVARMEWASLLSNGGQPDLVVTAVTVNAQEYVHSFQVSFTVTNQGAAAVTGLEVPTGLYVSSSATYDPFDFGPILAQSIAFQDLPQGGLLPGQSLNVQTWFIMESYAWNQAVGSRYLHVRADPWGQFQESNEDNNVLQGTAIQLSKADIDLHPTSLSAPATGSLGSPYTLSLSLENLGTNPATGVANQLYAQVFVSPDQTLNRSGENHDRLLGGFAIAGVSALGAGASGSGTVSFAPPGDLSTTQDYYLIVLLNDPQSFRQSQPETNQANNLIASPSTVRFGPPAADLTVTAASAGASSGNAGSTVQVSWTVRNQGTATAGVAPVEEWQSIWRDQVFVSNDATWDANDTPVTITTSPFGGNSIEIRTPLGAGGDRQDRRHLQPAGV